MQFSLSFFSLIIFTTLSNQSKKKKEKSPKVFFIYYFKNNVKIRIYIKRKKIFIPSLKKKKRFLYHFKVMDIQYSKRKLRERCEKRKNGEKVYGWIPYSCKKVSNLFRILSGSNINPYTKNPKITAPERKRQHFSKQNEEYGDIHPKRGKCSRQKLFQFQSNRRSSPNKQQLNTKARSSFALKSLGNAFVLSHKLLDLLKKKKIKTKSSRISTADRFMCRELL